MRDGPKGRRAHQAASTTAVRPAFFLPGADLDRIGMLPASNDHNFTGGFPCTVSTRARDERQAVVAGAVGLNREE